MCTHLWNTHLCVLVLIFPESSSESVYPETMYSSWVQLAWGCMWKRKDKYFWTVFVLPWINWRGSAHLESFPHCNLHRIHPWTFKNSPLNLIHINKALCWFTYLCLWACILTILSFVMNWEIKFSLSFWHLRCHYIIRISSFRTENVLVSPIKAFIDTSLCKRKNSFFKVGN